MKAPTKSRKGRNAAIYTRISQDRTGAGLGVERQQEECQALAQCNGLTVVQTFTDNDVSAYSGKPRLGYLALMEAVRAGTIDTILAWHEDRLHRSPRELEDFIDACKPREVPTLFAQSGELDLATSSGRMTARIRGAVARQESEHKSERVTAAAKQRAASGEPNGSLGYGWAKVAGKWVEVPEEGQVVREVVERLAARETLHAVTADLNRRAVPSPEGAMWDRLSEVERTARLSKGRKEPARQWGKTSVKKLALRESNVALRVHHRGQEDEEVVPGAWPALVERRVWEDARRVLGEPGRRTNGMTRPGHRSHLLTWGIGECGVCGGRLRVQRKKPRGYGKTVQVLYVCEKGCTGRNQAKVDELVRLIALGRLAEPDALDWMLGDADAAKEADRRLAEYRRREEEAGQLFAAGAISSTTLAAMAADLKPLIEEAQAERDRQVGARDLSTLTELAGPEAADRWEVMTVTQRRAVLQILGMRVQLLRAAKGPTFDPETVRVEWGSV